MGVYVQRWEKIKTDFETTTNQKRPKDTVKKILLGTVSKSTGITPLLKDIDTALEKKQRTPLEQALNKLMVARSTYGIFLMKEQAQFSDVSDDTNMVMFKAYAALMQGVQKLEEDASKEAKTLQETKSPNKEGITWLSLEGDMKGTIAAAKKDLTPFATLEKKHSVLKKGDAALKFAETYTKAAARTQPKEARQALESFKVEAKKCADDLTKVINAETDTNFKKAVTSFQNAMKALSTASRIDAQIKNLQTMGG